jgi:hypothetical protein
MTEWKKIKQFPLYEASENGEIKTFNWKNKGKEAIMKPANDACGYLRTMLKNEEGKFCTIKVHRIIAQTFIPNPENKPQVNHKNGIRSDNRVINLEWCTASENIKHSFNFLNRDRKYGEKNPAAKISEKDVIEIRKNYVYGKKSKQGKTKKELAKEYNTTFGIIKSIVLNKTWKHLL